MKVLTIGRTLPTKDTGSYGLFEFEQCTALNNFVESGYLFLEMSSILSNKKWESFNAIYRGIPTVGTYFPIKGIPKWGFNKVKTHLFIKYLKIFEQNYWKPDVLHFHFPLLTLNKEILDYLKDNHYKIVITEHWTAVQNKKLNHQQIELLKLTMQLTDGAIVVSEELKSSILDYTNISKEIFVIPNMVNNIFFDYPINNKKSNDITFTFIGALKKVKKVDFLLNVFNKVSEDRQGITLNIVGDGPERKRLQAVYEANNICFLGNKNHEEVRGVLSHTDIYVSGSNFETFGVPFIEAMAMGIPVICSDNIPFAKFVNKDNGILFKEMDMEDLSEKIQIVLENRDLYNSRDIRKEAKALFSDTAVAQKIISVYENIK